MTDEKESYGSESFWAFLYSGKGLSRKSKLWIIIILLAAPGFYVLSVGPAFWLIVETDSAIAHQLFMTFYWPLQILYDAVPAIQEPLDGYLDLWD